TRMQEDGFIAADVAKAAQGPLPTMVAVERTRRDSGFHFTDHLAREAKTLAGIDALTADSYTVHSTIRPDLQRATEAALQEGLARFEIDNGRVVFQGPEANLAEAVRRIEDEQRRTAPAKAAVGEPTDIVPPQTGATRPAPDKPGQKPSQQRPAQK